MKYLLVVIILMLLAMSGCDVGSSETEYTLTWTAPHEDYDDANSGAVDRYKLKKIELDSLDEAFIDWLEADSIVTDTPSFPGIEEQLKVNLKNNTIYAFAIWSYDTAGNESSISNIFKLETPDAIKPSKVTDLR